MFFDTAAAKEYFSYRSWPLRSVVETRILFHELRENLPHILSPTLLIYSENDPFVTPDHMEEIFKKLGTADKEKILVKQSGHNIPMDAERDRVLASIRSFIRRLEQKES